MAKEKELPQVSLSLSEYGSNRMNTVPPVLNISFTGKFPNLKRSVAKILSP